MPHWAMLAQLPWDLEPSILIGGAALIALYLWCCRPIRTGRLLTFLLGDFVMVLALVSPLDTLGDHYLFSAHMAQHLFLLDAAAPLLLLGIPASTWTRWLRFQPVAAVEARLRRPVVAWSIGFVTLALWHIPWLYDQAVWHEGLHIVEHLCFLVSAAIFWWPVLTPVETSQMDTAPTVFYLFSRMSADLMLGTVIAVAPVGIYAAYLHAPPAPFGLALSRAADQRLGGYIMWIPTLIVDSIAAPLVLASTARKAARKQPQPGPALPLERVP